MEKKLNFKLMLSLEEMALRRVVVSLWNETDILSSIVDLKYDYFDLYQFSVRYQIIVNKIKDKVSKLVLPESLKKGMIDIVKPIGSELLEWIKFHERNFNWSCNGLALDIFKQLCWSSVGTVDYQTTAEKLLHFEVLEVRARYKLAASYCLVDYIPPLWEQLPDSCKEYYSSEDTSWAEKVEMDFYWAYILAKGESKLDDIAAAFPCGDDFLWHAFLKSAVTGNKAATEYFFKIITKEKQNKWLPSIAISEVIQTRKILCPSDYQVKKLPDVLLYLLSLMRCEEQISTLKTFHCGILASFLDWPWQDLFLDIAERIWPFIPETYYVRFLRMIRDGIRNSGYYLPNLFQIFFLGSPSEFKKHFISDKNMLVQFFSEFFHAEDTETIEVIFRSAGIEDRMRMVSSENFFRLLDIHIMTDKWHMVKVCLDEATESEGGKARLKETYMEFLTRVRTRDERLRRRKWGEIFEAMDKISEVNTLTSAAEEKNDVLVKN